MSHIKSSELMNTVDVFFVQLFGEENYMKWQELKLQLCFDSEKKFVSWLLNYVTENFDLDKIIDEANDDLFINGQIEPKKGDIEESPVEEDVKGENETPPSDVPPLAISEDSTKEELEDDRSDDSVSAQRSQPVLPCHDSPAQSSRSHEVLLEVDDRPDDDDDGRSADFDVGITPHFMDVSSHDDATGGHSDDRDVIGEFPGETNGVQFCADVFDVDTSPGTPFPCKKCGKFFRHRGDMQRHVKEIHLNIRKYACDHCGRSFSRSYILKKHVEAIHMDIRNHGCCYCSSKFSTKSNLNIHIKRYHPWLTV